MNRYRIRISVDGKRKLYYIEDQENYDIVLLPSKYLSIRRTPTGRQTRSDGSPFRSATT